MDDFDEKRYSISLDLSTTNVGVALWDGNGKLIELKHLQLNIDKKIIAEERYLHKADLFRDYISKYKKSVETKYACVIENVIIEKPLPNTKVNIDTTAMLLGFNGIACYMIYKEFGFAPNLISVYESRRIFCPELLVKKGGKLVLSFPKNVDKKEYIWNKVNKLEPNIKWIYGTKSKTLKKESFDMSDAFCCGFAALKQMGVIK